MKIALCCICLLAVSSFALADTIPIVNGGFETGTLAGWSATSNVQITTSAIGVSPTQGTYQAILNNVSITPPTFSDVSFVTLSNLVLSYGLPLLFSGATLEQSFDASASGVLQFNWDFLSMDAADFAVFDLNGALHVLSIHSLVLGKPSINPPTLPSNTAFGLETGYQTFSLPISSGVQHIGFGAFNTSDNLFPSALLIDNVTLTPVVVPEPSAWLLLGSGLLFTGLLRRRMTRVNGRRSVFAKGSSWSACFDAASVGGTKEAD